jgi:hypothetical protein
MKFCIHIAVSKLDINCPSSITITIVGWLDYKTDYCSTFVTHEKFAMFLISIFIIHVNPPPFRGSLPRKSLISRMDWVSCAGDINLPHTPFPPARYPPNKKIKYNTILTYILRSIFLEIPHLELPRWWKTPRDTNVNDIQLLICLTPLQVNWVMVIN